MESTTSKTASLSEEARSPFKVSYGKMMMWFFLFSDALTFSGFLAAYGFSRYRFVDSWPIADEVFTHFPFMHGVDMPMYYVAFMTFILIFSSVTMVLAVNAGHHMKKSKVTNYMLLTIIGGLIFVGSQAWEWKNFIQGEFGAVETRGGQVLQFVDSSNGHRVALEDFSSHFSSERIQNKRKNGVWFENEPSLSAYTVDEVKAGFDSHPNILARSQKMDENGEKIILSREETSKLLSEATYVIKGANLARNEYGSPLFANFFFFITGFHGLHVFSGVMINIIILINIILGTYEKRKSYEMVEKVGLYWHFVDLVWVFVFTFFYLV